MFIVAISVSPFNIAIVPSSPSIFKNSSFNTFIDTLYALSDIATSLLSVRNLSCPCFISIESAIPAYGMLVVYFAKYDVSLLFSSVPEPVM